MLHRVDVLPIVAAPAIYCNRGALTQSPISQWIQRHRSGDIVVAYSRHSLERRAGAGQGAGRVTDCQTVVRVIGANLQIGQDERRLAGDADGHPIRGPIVGQRQAASDHYTQLRADPHRR